MSIRTTHDTGAILGWWISSRKTLINSFQLINYIQFYKICRHIFDLGLLYKSFTNKLFVHTKECRRVYFSAVDKLCVCKLIKR